MSQYDFEKTLFSYIDNVRQQQSVRPLSLGGVAGSSGGSGGPTGGAIGQLTQSRVTFDTTEAETWGFETVSGVPSGTSLVTNLNRIRYRLKGAERKEQQFTFSGTATIGSNPYRIYNFTNNRVIKDVHVSVGTAPTGDTLVVDANINGTTMFSNQEHRPTIAIGDFHATASLVDSSTWNVNSYLTVDIDQVGSSVAGSNVVVYIIYTEG